MQKSRCSELKQRDLCCKSIRKCAYRVNSARRESGVCRDAIVGAAKFVENPKSVIEYQGECDVAGWKNIALPFSE